MIYINHTVASQPRLLSLAPLSCMSCRYTCVGRAGLSRCSSVWARQHPNKGPMPYFEWQPQECWLEKVDAAKFCHVMEGRKGLLFVGED